MGRGVKKYENGLRHEGMYERKRSLDGKEITKKNLDEKGSIKET